MEHTTFGYCMSSRGIHMVSHVTAHVCVESGNCIYYIDLKDYIVHSGKQGHFNSKSSERLLLASILHEHVLCDLIVYTE